MTLTIAFALIIVGIVGAVVNMVAIAIHENPVITVIGHIFFALMYVSGFIGVIYLVVSKFLNS